jgi:NADH-quinone oxidoreductase subunit G
MPVFELDGKKIEFAQGNTIIEAAYKSGMEVPHFCWHPELSVAGNCRMCLAEVGTPRRDREGNFEKDENGNPIIGFIPKLQVACATPASEGMVVRTKSDKASQAQEAVTEFILINHPLDCPICDEAGECKLQEYSFKHSTGKSRFDEEKNHAKKHQVWGPNVIFDAERCIACSRCIRFGQEVAKQDVLTFVQRGDHVTIELFDGTAWDNPYSMNVVELCPVGALTSSDFRFSSRVWEMSFNPSISVADGSGSNTFLGVKNNEILRVQPRTNMHTNKYWLTDDARLNYIDYVNKNRITNPQAKLNGQFVDISWDEISTQIARKLKDYSPSSTMILSSALATNESNYAAKVFAEKIIGTQNIDYFEYLDKSRADDLIGNADLRPNTKGAASVGARSESGVSASKLIENINDKSIKVLIVAEDDLSNNPELISSLDNLELLIVIGYNNTELSKKADFLLPASTYAETEGTFTNTNGRVQHFSPALVTKENLRHMGMKMSRWDAFGSVNDRWTRHELRSCRSSWRILSGIAHEMGTDFAWKKSEDVFLEISKNINDFSGMNYKLLSEFEGINLGNSSSPDPKIINYTSHKMKPQAD